MVENGLGKGMYSESDIDAAVAAGKLSAEAADNFRAFIAAQKTAPAVDEEYVRLLTGFNDIFVSIAIMLVLGAICFTTGSVPVKSAAVAIISWGLAEYFTRRRRMALPSILLLLSYAAGVAGLLAWGVGQLNGAPVSLVTANANPTLALGLAGAAVLMGGAAYAHWRRFHVPITIAAGTAAVALTLIGVLVAAVPSLAVHWPWLVFAAGLAIFTLALRWDMADLARTTRRTDVAFWLHLLAAPMLVHPLFFLLGLLHSQNPGESRAFIAIGIYLLLGLVALLVDRRALLVSALGYVMFALSTVLKASGMVGQDLTYTALVAGAALLLLSAFWHKARQGVMVFVPTGMRRFLPPA
jgi:hypothetical protein